MSKYAVAMLSTSFRSLAGLCLSGNHSDADLLPLARPLGHLIERQKELSLSTVSPTRRMVERDWSQKRNVASVGRRRHRDALGSSRWGSPCVAYLPKITVLSSSVPLVARFHKGAPVDTQARKSTVMGNTSSGEASGASLSDDSAEWGSYATPG